MTCDDSLVDWTAECATTLLSPLGNRWLHVQGVVERVRQVGEAFNEDDRCCLIAAAYLHDIGYAPVPTKSAKGQNRTGDTSIFSAVLYRLSYLGVECNIACLALHVKPLFGLLGQTVEIVQLQNL